MAIKVLSKMQSRQKVKSGSIWALHLIILARTSGCNRSDKKTFHSSIGQSPIIPRKFFPCQLESYKINPSNKSGRAIALPAPPPPRSLAYPDRLLILTIIHEFFENSVKNGKERYSWLGRKVSSPLLKTGITLACFSLEE